LRAENEGLESKRNRKEGREKGEQTTLIPFEVRHTRPNECLQECSHIQNKPLLIEPRTNEKQRHPDTHGREEGACRLIEGSRLIGSHQLALDVEEARRKQEARVMEEYDIIAPIFGGPSRLTNRVAALCREEEEEAQRTTLWESGRH
jgi:hypothetical protein